MQIAGRPIGPNHPPAIVAEIGGNHGGSLQRAFELIDAAKAAGADFVKFQCFTPDTLTLDCDRPEFLIADGPWKGRPLYELAKETYAPLTWFPELFERAQEAGIVAFSSVFDKSSIDLLEKLGCPAYKIASFELVDLPLIRHAASTGKPLIISTGMASDEELWDAARTIRETPGRHEHGNAIPLHCISGYPTAPAHANLAKLQRWAKIALVGISDHTTGPEIPSAATALGACIIEKHFKLTRHPNTEDGPFSMSPVPFAKMVKAVRNTWAAMQPPTGPDPEASSRPLRRSLFAVTDIPAGSPFTEANVRSIRPGNGLPPKELPNLIGCKAARNISRGEPMNWEMVES